MFDPLPQKKAIKKAKGRVARFPDPSFTRSPSSALLLLFGEGSPTEIGNNKRGTLILASLLEDLV